MALDLQTCRRLMTLLVLVIVALGCATTRTPLRPVVEVNLPRYMGDWYVIANIPYFAERNCFDSVESYKLRKDGSIDNAFSCRKGSFQAPLERQANARAVVDDTVSNAMWHVRFFKIISVKYLILDLDPDYQWVAVGHPSRRYGWVLARAQNLPDVTYGAILQRLAAQGYDIRKFKKVPQQSAQASASN